jgi:hypothetical protein
VATSSLPRPIWHAGFESEDVRSVEVGIFDLDIPGYNGGKRLYLLGLPEYLE